MNYERKEFLFSIINNREFDLVRSNINALKETISKRFDKIKHTVDVEFKHHTVYELINQLSTYKVENFKLSKKNGFEIQHHPFIDMELVREKLENTDYLKPLPQILSDLNDLGLFLILFFIFT